MEKKAFPDLTTDEVLEYYGYKPEDVHRNGVGYGVWQREDAFYKLNDMGTFMSFVNDKEKARIEFNYDPDFPAALLVTYVTLKV